MDNLDLMTRLSVVRGCVEQDLALGRRRRARRRAGPALHALVTALHKPEPELCSWLRILAALAAVDRPEPGPQQLSLWPDEGAGALRAAAGLPADRGTRRPVPAAGLGVVTQDERMLDALRFLERLSPTELPVLVEGESGTGKEVVARAIHAMSGRDRGPWVAVNCGAMPAQLQESELFGHARGAFTGAASDKPGLFEAADGGTLFLDEVGEMDLRAQVKLLRVLESGELRRLGEVRTRAVDVRIVAATNVDVDEAVRAGRLRKDLLFRLGAVRVWLPPLRGRPGDILPLAYYFIRRSSPPMPGLTPGARYALLAHDWPGNVRELRFTIERALALWRSSGAGEVSAEMLFPGLRREPAVRASAGDAARIGGPAGACGTARIGCPAGADGANDPSGDLTLPGGRRLEEHLVEVERRLIAQALRQAGGNRTRAARLLGGLSRSTLLGKMKRLGLAELEPCAAVDGGGVD